MHGRAEAAACILQQPEAQRPDQAQVCVPALQVPDGQSLFTEHGL
jgi:hypothetical protein